MKSIHVLLLVSLFMISGCVGTGKQYPNYARIQPVDSFTAKHPLAMEQAGDQVVTFHAIMPWQYLTEAEFILTNSGEYEPKGIWPIIAVDDLNEESSIESGFCYPEGEMFIGENLFIRMQCIVPGTRKHFGNRYKFGLPNKDGGQWFSIPVGNLVLSADKDEWDHKKFDDDFKYRTRILSTTGQTLDEIDRAWQDIVAAYGVGTLAGDVEEFTATLKSVRWQKFRTKMISDIGFEIVLPDGKMVVSFYDLDEAIVKQSRNPMITPLQKAASAIRIPIIPSLEAVGYGLLSSVVNGGIAASIDSEWKSVVARGTVQRKEFATHMMYFMSKLQKSHAKIMRLRQAATKK